MVLRWAETDKSTVNCSWRRNLIGPPANMVQVDAFREEAGMKSRVYYLQ